MRNQDQVYLILLVESLRGEYFLRCIFSAKNAQNLVTVQNLKSCQDLLMLQERSGKIKNEF